MVLLRRLVGDVLRRHRLRQSRTLREVSAAAQVSLGYLSEVERGRKEASSELLAAICAALDVSLADVLREVSDDLTALERPMLAPLGFRPAPHTKVSSGARAGAVAGMAPLRPGRALPARPVPERPAGTPPGTTRPAAPVAQLSVRTVAAA
jgi:transcriptional regulator with XRE-family HTH domain